MKNRQVRLSQNHMATTFALTLCCEEGERAKADSVLLEAHQLLKCLENDLSEFRPQSSVTQFNQAGANIWIGISQHFKSLLLKCIELDQTTQGAFDVTFRSKIKHHLHRRIEWDHFQIKKLDADLKIGFGAIGKGYALDQVRTLVEREGFRDYSLNAGGSSIILSGFALQTTHGLEPWKFVWSTEGDKGVLLEHQSGKPISLGMSGTSEQGFHITGSHHESPLGTLIAADSAADADALSTGLFAAMSFVSLKSDSSPDWMATTKARAAAVMMKNKQLSWTQGFEKWFRAPVLTVALMLISSLTSIQAWAEEEGAIDLESLGESKFNPYLYERSLWWILPAVFILLMTLLHLKKGVPGIIARRHTHLKGKV